MTMPGRGTRDAGRGTLPRGGAPVKGRRRPALHALLATEVGVHRAMATNMGLK